MAGFCFVWYDLIMNINLKSTDIELTKEIKSYLEKKLEGVEKFLPKNNDDYITNVELGRTTEHHRAGDVFFAEINIHIGGKSFRAVSDRADLYSAIDDMKDEIARELGSDKEKRVSLLRRSGQKLKWLMRRFYR